MLQSTSFIKSIGGIGHIHGAIVDIDYFNHIYVNPYDGKVTPYFAENVIDKTMYPSLGMLLQEHCPSIYESYRLTCSEKSLPAMQLPDKDSFSGPVEYKNTDFYWSSHLLFKLQKLYDNILTVWTDEITPYNQDKQVKREVAPHSEINTQKYKIECGTVLSDSGDKIIIAYNDMLLPTEKKVYINSKGRYIQYNGKNYYLDSKKTNNLLQE